MTSMVVVVVVVVMHSSRGAASNLDEAEATLEPSTLKPISTLTLPIHPYKGN